MRAVALTLSPISHAGQSIVRRVAHRASTWLSSGSEEDRLGSPLSSVAVSGANVTASVSTQTDSSSDEGSMQMKTAATTTTGAMSAAATTTTGAMSAAATMGAMSATIATTSSIEAAIVPAEQAPRNLLAALTEVKDDNDMEEEDEDGEIFEAQRFIDYAEIEHDAKTQEAINVLAALHDELYASGDVRLQAYVSRQKKQMFLTRRRGAPVVAHFAPEADTGTETILGIVKAKADNNMGKKNPCVRLLYWFIHSYAHSGLDVGVRLDCRKVWVLFVVARIDANESSIACDPIRFNSIQFNALHTYKSRECYTQR